MPIFIAKNYDGKVESVILAKNYELANAYWQGKNISAFSTEEKSEKDLIGHITGVLPIVNTIKKELSYQGGRSHECLLIAK